MGKIIFIGMVVVMLFLLACSKQEVEPVSSPRTCMNATKVSMLNNNCFRHCSTSCFKSSGLYNMSCFDENGDGKLSPSEEAVYHYESDRNHKCINGCRDAYTIEELSDECEDDQQQVWYN